MRLIDTDKLFESIREYEFDTTTPEMRRAEHLVKSHICELIERQPTIYDVDKVVEQLEELGCKGCEYVGDFERCVRDCEYKEITEAAIDIVKSGGIDGH